MVISLRLRAIAICIVPIALIGGFPRSQALAFGTDEKLRSISDVEPTRSTDSTCIVTSADMAQGNRLVRAGRFVEGRAKLLSALEVLEQYDTPDPVNRACLMNMIGFVEQQQRRPDLALDWFQRALDLKPRSDALVVLITGNLANAYADLNRMDQAEEAARRAFQLSVRVFGPDNEESLFPKTILALIQVARGDFSSAEPVLRRAVALAERSWNGSSYLRAVAASNLGLIYFVTHRFALARDLFQESLECFDRDSIRANVQILLTQALLAGSYAAEGRRGEANVWLELALVRAQQELSRDDPALAIVLERAASAKFCLEEYEAGRELFDRAIAVLEARFGPDSQPVQDALERYAAFLRLAKDKTRAQMLEARRKAFARKH